MDRSRLARRRLLWIGWGFTSALSVLAAAAVFRALVGWPQSTIAVLSGALALIPGSLVLSAFERTNAAVERVVAASTRVVAAAAIVGAVYLLVVLVLGRVPSEGERVVLALSMVAAAVSGLLIAAAQERIRDAATRIAYGRRAAPDDAARSFAARMSRALPLDELLLQMVESLRRTLSLHAAEVWTGAGGTFERSVSQPELPPVRITLSSAEEPVVARARVSGRAWAKVWLPAVLGADEGEHVRVAPATHAGELFGLIVVRRRADAPPFDDDDDTTLAELARQVGVALQNVRLDSALQASLDELREQARELQASRSRIVAAADAARRNIERNLHDGAQQHLVALAVKLRLARQAMGADPAAAAAMLQELSGDVQETLEELRRLAHGIYPPLLADRGLPEALRAAAGRASVPTSVDLDGIGRYAPEIESAVYFCSLEALQNVAKYAGDGAAATVRVWEAEQGLLFEIADDGAGFEVTRTGAGAGFTNMNDRVGAIGGSLRVESAPGRGTRVTGRIPLR